MRICIDASNISRGGGVTHLIEVLRQLDAAEAQVDFVAVWGCAATLAQLEDRPWLHKRTDAVLERNFLRRAVWQRNRLGRLAEEDRCDLLFVPGGSFATSFRPVVTMSRNLLPFEPGELKRYGLHSQRFKMLALRWTQARSYRLADGVIFLNRYARESVSNVTGPLRALTALIPHGVDARFFAAPRPPRALADCTPDDPLRLVYVSIIDVYKHQASVAQAVAALRSRGIPIRLDLIGPAFGPALDELQRTLAVHDPKGQAVRLLGPIPYRDLPGVYAGADVGVFASSCENMPNILLEMMAAGLPIACSNRGPMPEVLGKGVYFDPESVDEISAALEKLATDPSLRAEMASAAHQRAQGFSWKRCAADTAAFLRTVIERHRGAAPSNPAVASHQNSLSASQP